MIESDHVWQELLPSALLGTDRHPLSSLTSSGGLGNLLTRLDTTNPGKYLLQASAILAFYRRAGILPVYVQEESGELPVCQADELSRCSPAAASLLANMLAGDQKELIPEWLSLAALAQKRVPEEYLPDFLGWSEKNISQIDLILPVLGKRGRWLAGRLGSFDNLTAATVVEVLEPESASGFWQVGRKVERIQLLRRLRQSEPQQALELINSTWSEESAGNRAGFVGMLEHGLSMADEPFLEECLDDRSVLVRRAAVDLLVQLSDSRLVARQTERAEKYLIWTPGSLLKKANIEVDLPQVCAPAMTRDGVADKTIVLKTCGEKFTWFLQILGAVPPSFWSRQWGKSPTELLEITKNSDWKDLLHRAWTAAACRHKDPDWLEALLNRDPKNGQMLLKLPLERRMAYLKTKIRSQPREGVKTLCSYQGAWGTELTRLALPNLQAYFLDHNDQARLMQPRNIFVNLGLYMDPSLRSEIEKKLLKNAQSGLVWRRAVEDLLVVLEYRQRMMEELYA